MKRAACFALLLLLATPAVAEKWYEAYNRGVKAVNARSYDSAVEALQRSLSEMPNEGTSVRARNEIIVYVPHFWLGIARFNLGDPDGALREWRISEEQGAIQNTDYYAKMRDWVARAQAEKHRMAQSASADARKATDALVSRAMSSQMDALAAGGDRSETYRQGQRRLQEAIDQFNKAGTDSRAYHRAGETANQARELFVSAAEESRRAKAARPAATPKQQPPVEVSRVQVQAPPQRPPAEAAKPVPQKPQPEVAQKTPKPQPVPAAQPAAPPSRTWRAKRSWPPASRCRSIGPVFPEPPRNEGTTRSTSRFYAPRARDAAIIDQDLQKKNDAATIKRAVDFVEARQRELDSLTAVPVAATQTTATPAAGSRSQLERAYRAFAHGDIKASDEILTGIIASGPSAEAFLLRGCARYTQASSFSHSGARLERGG